MPQLYAELGPVAVTTTGSAGSAGGSGTTSEIVNGGLYSIYVDYSGSAPATTKLVIQDTKGRTLWTGTSANNGIGNSDKMIYPRGGIAADQIIALAGQKITFVLSLSDALAPAATIYPIILN